MEARSGGLSADHEPELEGPADFEQSRAGAVRIAKRAVEGVFSNELASLIKLATYAADETTTGPLKPLLAMLGLANTSLLRSYFKTLQIRSAWSLVNACNPIPDLTHEVVKLG